MKRLMVGCLAVVAILVLRSASDAQVRPILSQFRTQWQNMPSSGLIAAYDQVSGIGTPLVDTSGVTGNGTLTSSLAWSSVGPSFDGASTYINLPRMTALEGTADFSAVFIVRAHSVKSDSNTIWSIGDTATINHAQGFAFAPANKFRWFIWGGDDTDGGSYTVGVWYAVVLTKSGTTGTVYVNGTSAFTKDMTSLSVSNNFNRLGELPHDTVHGYADADIAYAAWYSRVLTAGEISSISTYATTEAMQRPSAFTNWATGTWVVNPTPIITKGTGGDFDAGWAYSASWIYESGTYYVYYGAWDASSLNGAIGLATGSSLAALTKQGAVLTHGAGGTWDSAYSACPGILHDGATYYLFYCGSQTASFEGIPSEIGVATSTSPFGPFTKQGQQIALGGAGTWNQRTMYRSNPIKFNGQYWLYYNAERTSDNKSQIGYATATNPIGGTGAWTDHGVAIPITTTGSASGIGDPELLPVNSGWLMMWYGSGALGDNKDRISRSSDLANWSSWPSIFTFSGVGGTLMRLYVGNVSGVWLGTVDDDSGGHIYMATAVPAP